MLTLNNDLFFSNSLSTMRFSLAFHISLTNIKLKIDMMMLTPVFSMFCSISEFKAIRFQVAGLFGTLQNARR